MIATALSLTMWRSTERVWAGEITEVSETGCMVRQKSGSATFYPFDKRMVNRPLPTIGDYWIIYEGGFQLTKPRWAFDLSYERIPDGETR